jgi:hypothetical protein
MNYQNSKIFTCCVTVVDSSSIQISSVINYGVDHYMLFFAIMDDTKFSV